MSVEALRTGGDNSTRRIRLFDEVVVVVGKDGGATVRGFVKLSFGHVISEAVTARRARTRWRHLSKSFAARIYRPNHCVVPSNRHIVSVGSSSPTNSLSLHDSSLLQIPFHSRVFY